MPWEKRYTTLYEIAHKLGADKLFRSLGIKEAIVEERDLSKSRVRLLAYAVPFLWCIVLRKDLCGKESILDAILRGKLTPEEKARVVSILLHEGMHLEGVKEPGARYAEIWYICRKLGKRVAKRHYKNVLGDYQLAAGLRMLLELRKKGMISEQRFRKILIDYYYADERDVFGFLNLEDMTAVRWLLKRLSVFGKIDLFKAVHSFVDKRALDLRDAKFLRIGERLDLETVYRVLPYLQEKELLEHIGKDKDARTRLFKAIADIPEPEYSNLLLHGTLRIPKWLFGSEKASHARAFLQRLRVN